jgi:hypothetical protein
MCFDFYDAYANMQPPSVPVRLRFDAEGVWNAVAFWFDLQLDEETELSTSPYGVKVGWGCLIRRPGFTSSCSENVGLRWWLVTDRRTGMRRLSPYSAPAPSLQAYGIFVVGFLVSWQWFSLNTTRVPMRLG